LVLGLVGLALAADQVAAWTIRRQIQSQTVQALSRAGLEADRVEAGQIGSGLWALLTGRLDSLRLDLAVQWPTGGGRVTAELSAQDVRWGSGQIRLSRLEAALTAPAESLASLADQALAERPEIGWLSGDGLVCRLDPAAGQIELVSERGLTVRLEPLVRPQGAVLAVVGWSLFGLPLPDLGQSFELDLSGFFFGAQVVAAEVGPTGLRVDLLAQDLVLS
jgi:hypothetical protein